MKVLRALHQVALLGVLAACASAPAAAQSPLPEPGGETAIRPAYLPYRYDEDWSVLRDPRLRTDAFDPLKYIQFGRSEDWYLSVGGELRGRYEQVRHAGFGSQPEDESGYFLQRYLLHTDWHLGRHARMFFELQSGLEDGRVGGPRVTDENRLDAHQAFVDLMWGSRQRGSLTVRAGRQEVAFGAGRLISAAEGLNVRRSFDGVRVTARRKGWQSNATLMRLVATKNGLFDDNADEQQLSWGFGGFGPLPGGRGDNVALYYLGHERDAARFDQGTARATRHVVGARTWRLGSTFDYDQEVIVQWGRFGDGAIRAWAVASEDGITPPWLPGRTRLGVRFFAASGDRDPTQSRLESFDPLFPGIAYSGKASLIGPTNLITLDPSVAFSIHPRVRLAFDWAQFWRTSEQDGVYGINVAVLRTGQLSDRRLVGSQATLEIEARLSTHFTIWGSITGFRTGPFLAETPPGENLRYFSAHAAYRF